MDADSDPLSVQRSIIARFRSADGLQTIDPDSGEVLLDLEQPAKNHNGGQIRFGPDGLLYIALGDGGGAGDAHGNGQDPTTPLGAILRIDVDREEGDLPYGIPADNPFADGSGGAPEVYAYGLRNPWRFQFDRDTGALWAGDVGQREREEVNRIERGGNYGWPIREGATCFEADSCDTSGLIDPVVDYSRGESASVIMGPVYRGDAIPSLVGAPLLIDFYEGALHAIFYDDVSGAPHAEPVAASTGAAYAAFAENDAGEVYAADFYTGQIHRLVPAGAPSPSAFPERLSETGCVDAADPRLPAEGLIPYTISHPFWSDGAEKERWLAVPDGETIAVGADGRLELPVGSVVVKHFSLGGERIETRLMVRHDDGYWAGYSYAWQGDGDATYVPGGASAASAGGQPWTWPSSAECLRCHTAAAGRTLGLTAAQLAVPHTYPSTGRTADQLQTLAHIGLLDDDDDVLDTEPLPGRDHPDAEAAARAWLAVNCAGCHQPDGPGGGSLDLRSGTPLAETGACDEPAQGGDEGALIAPGQPDASVLVARVAADDVRRMPPLGSHLIDEEGLTLLRDWIRGLEGCPEQR